MKSQCYFICFFLFYSLFFIWINCSDSPPFLPNYYWVGSGFDSRNASITQVSFGIKQPIVSYSGRNITPDGSWSIPNGLYPYTYAACAQSPATTKTVSGAYAYSKEISTSVSTSIGVGKLYQGSTSTDMQSTQKEGLEFNVYLYDSWVICETYQLALNTFTKYNLTNEFITGVSTLPTSFNSNSQDDINTFETFFRNYGDTFINYAIEGGVLAQRASISGYTKASLEQQSIDVSQQAQISFEVTIGESTSTNTSTSGYQKFSENATFSAIVTLGGDNSYFNDYPDWINSIQDSPVPVKFSLLPVSSWMNSEYFPNDDDIENRGNAYSEFVQWYFETKSNFVVFDPFYNIALNQGGKYQQSSSVSCPSGSILLSGGCTTNDLSSTNWPWRISETYPIDNSGSPDSWNCLNGEDDGTGTYYYDSIAYVICTADSFTVDIGNGTTQTISVSTDIKSASSNSNEEYKNSVSTSTCDSGYYLVGGGCTVSDSDNDHPWIIRASYPSNNAWYCLAAEDYNTVNHDVSVTAYAICAKWESSLTYVPSLPLDYKIVTCTSSNTEQYKNSCNSICPSGYLVVGGGCTVSDTDSSNWPWRLSESIPSNNGWLCSSGEDNGSREYYMTVTAYAICVQF